VYNDAGLKEPVPAIMSENILKARRLEVGDTMTILVPGNQGNYFEFSLHIIGTHNGGIRRPWANFASIIPHSAMEFLFKGQTRMIVVQFDIDPIHNRNLDEIREELQRAVHNWHQNYILPLEIFLFDSELRLVISQLENNLSLLRILRPIAVVVSLIIGAGLSLLIILQTAKNAAIMRVLGGTRSYTIFTLLLGQAAVTVVGVCVAFIMLPIIGGVLEQIMHFGGFYLISAVTGSFMGAYIITRNSPLELLQVKE